MKSSQPLLLIMAGPTGARKSSCASLYLPPSVPYINADDIARTLPGRPTREAEVQAARIALETMDEAEARRESFATETTLASKTLASRAIRLRQAGYFFQLVYVWSPSPDFSVLRFAQRVRHGGHDIPEDTIRRRWLAGVKNFFSLYQPIADQWDVIDNSTTGLPLLVAKGCLGQITEIRDQKVWDELDRRANDAT